MTASLSLPSVHICFESSSSSITRRPSKEQKRGWQRRPGAAWVHLQQLQCCLLRSAIWLQAHPAEQVQRDLWHCVCWRITTLNIGNNASDASSYTFPINVGRTENIPHRQIKLPSLCDECDTSCRRSRISHKLSLPDCQNSSRGEGVRGLIPV